MEKAVMYKLERTFKWKSRLKTNYWREFPFLVEWLTCFFPNGFVKLHSALNKKETQNIENPSAKVCITELPWSEINLVPRAFPLKFGRKSSGDEVSQKNDCKRFLNLVPRVSIRWEILGTRLTFFHFYDHNRPFRNSSGNWGELGRVSNFN